MWKNGSSNYVPNWVKINSQKFFRAENRFGKKINSISPLCEDAVAADKKAFVELLTFIRDYDEEEGTVIAIQIENEMGLLTTDRDYSTYANNKYFDLVPSELIEVYGKNDGKYEEVFGEEAPEIFMVYSFAKAVNEIGILNYEEGSIISNHWKAGRQLNGDDRYTIRYYSMPDIRRLELFNY